MYRRERFNVFSHALGVVLSLIGIAYLVGPAISRGELDRTLAFLIYGLGLLSVYSGSSIYHALRGKPRRIMRRFDRSAIYLMIAGTYTPLALTLPTWLATFVLTGVWILAAIGVTGEWREKAQSSVTLYLLMGWFGLPLMPFLIQPLGWTGILALVVGGMFYTVGSMIAGAHRIPRNHEIWHVLVLLGSACHFFVMAHGA